MVGVASSAHPIGHDAALQALIASSDGCEAAVDTWDAKGSGADAQQAAVVLAAAIYEARQAGVDPAMIEAPQAS